MPGAPNVFLSFPPSGDSTEIVQPGDVALILKHDGSVQAVTFGYDRNRLFRPEAELTEQDKTMLLQGEKLFALALAANNPRIMRLLLDIAADPDVVDFDALKRQSRLN